MYNLFSIDMNSEEDAQEKAQQMVAARYPSSVRISANGKTVSVDMDNPLVSDIAKMIGLIFKTLTYCINERLCYQKLFKHASP